MYHGETVFMESAVNYYEIAREYEAKAQRYEALAESYKTVLGDAEYALSKAIFMIYNLPPHHTPEGCGEILRDIEDTLSQVKDVLNG